MRAVRPRTLVCSAQYDERKPIDLLRTTYLGTH
jgi:hypothetical protein